MTMTKSIGNRIAPPRFIAYALALATSIAFALMQPSHALEFFLIGFDVATLGFLLSTVPMFRHSNPDTIIRHAKDNDANRVALLAISVAVIFVVLGAVALVVTGKDEYSKALVIVTLAIAWLFANLIYAFHYAHLYYLPGKKPGGLLIPSTNAPDYFDFLHFSLILGMTFQTADIDITSQAIRRVSTIHCLEAFIFNIGILAFSINMIAGS